MQNCTLSRGPDDTAHTRTDSPSRVRTVSTDPAQRHLLGSTDRRLTSDQGTRRDRMKTTVSPDGVTVRRTHQAPHSAITVRAPHRSRRPLSTVMTAMVANKTAPKVKPQTVSGLRKVRYGLGTTSVTRLKMPRRAPGAGSPCRRKQMRSERPFRAAAFYERRRLRTRPATAKASPRTAKMMTIAPIAGRPFPTSAIPLISTPRLRMMPPAQSKLTFLRVSTGCHCCASQEAQQVGSTDRVKLYGVTRSRSPKAAFGASVGDSL